MSNRKDRRKASKQAEPEKPPIILDETHGELLIDTNATALANLADPRTSYLARHESWRASRMRMRQKRHDGSTAMRKLYLGMDQNFLLSLRIDKVTREVSGEGMHAPVGDFTVSGAENSGGYSTTLKLDLSLDWKNPRYRDTRLGLTTLENWATLQGKSAKGLKLSFRLLTDEEQDHFSPELTRLYAWGETRRQSTGDGNSTDAGGATAADTAAGGEEGEDAPIEAGRSKVDGNDVVDDNGDDDDNDDDDDDDDDVQGPPKGVQLLPRGPANYMSLRGPLRSKMWARGETAQKEHQSPPPLPPPPLQAPPPLSEPRGRGRASDKKQQPSEPLSGADLLSGKGKISACRVCAAGCCNYAGPSQRCRECGVLGCY